ncbi:MAG: (Fe-S)-binding protein [Desulfobacterales bacterium]|nr:(Fe-S)-binding protein [Desulfobacterales bacterium]
MGDLSQAGREVMWNINGAWIMYLMLLISLLCLGIGVISRIKVLMRGKQDQERFNNLFYRFVIMIKEIMFQKKVRNVKFPGIFHSMFFYSFIVLFITTAVILADYDLGTHLFKGYVYAFLTIASDMGGALILLGILMALFRRYVLKPDTLDNDISDAGLLLLLAFIIITGFLVEGIRIDVTKDLYATLSPVGLSISTLFSAIPEESGRRLHGIMWWLHTFSVFAFIALIPYSKFFHLLTMPANAFFSKIKPAGELNRVDLEELISSDDFDEDDFSIGIDTTGDLSWKHRLDLAACVSCGRCEEVCPPFMADQPFSPKKFISGIKDVITEAEADWTNSKDRSTFFKEIVGNAFSEEFIWYCRTCMACVEACPAFIEHVDSLIDIRRNEVNMKGRINSDASRALRTMETMGNPFNPQDDRIDWVETLDASILNPGESCDVLYWIGCLTTFDSEKQKIAVDLITLLKKNNINVSILGPGEHCCGDPARVTGEENLFQMVAKDQVEELNSRKFKTLLVSCPHCYNVLKNEYPQFGGKFNVVHYTDFIYDNFIKDRRLSINGTKRVVAYHDPCYLGRYQKIYKSPRNVIKSLPNVKLVEMQNNCGKSLCCGGGGGHFFMDIREGERINNLRIKQAKETGADTLVTACPFCKHMLEDSLKLMDLEKEIEITDIVSLVLKAVEKKN